MIQTTHLYIRAKFCTYSVLKFALRPLPTFAFAIQVYSPQHLLLMCTAHILRWHYTGVYHLYALHLYRTPHLLRRKSYCTSATLAVYVYCAYALRWNRTSDVLLTYTTLVSRLHCTGTNLELTLRNWHCVYNDTNCTIAIFPCTALILINIALVCTTLAQHHTLTHSSCLRMLHYTALRWHGGDTITPTHQCHILVTLRVSVTCTCIKDTKHYICVIPQARSSLLTWLRLYEASSVMMMWLLWTENYKLE